ncbi:translation factor GUF1 homolog, chloroplastic-like isoform X1 [Zingiber officinale]|uniref:translation factor GUF1 homolog, chloroplastic-like isoform X1 n=1 Tax=Zingiber officinale TaxID=94328 RepID=UPI001C4C7B72|nr:translation factor GUF1 homolog, chloroplastic-like isoform X1 [Zingiber officinale]
MSAATLCRPVALVPRSSAPRQRRRRSLASDSLLPVGLVSCSCSLSFSPSAGFSGPRPRLRVLCRAAGTESKTSADAPSPNVDDPGRDRLLKVPISNIRNFCIIAHIDHGKSTLADKLLQLTGTVQMREMKEQFLDNMDLERERGITIKLQAARMRYVLGNEPYCLNLIDTPGHVDFSYEVSRSLAACEGALLVVDASQGVEAQTLANVYLALENNLEIIPVLNKIDLPGAEPDRIAQEIEEIIGLDCSNAIHCSAKEGIGITEILNAIITRIPPPKDTSESPMRALIFDSYYDPYRGVIVYFRVVDGNIKKGDRIYFIASGKDYYADEIGVLSPNQMQVNELYAGEVGYLSASIRSVADARVGDTITQFGRRAESSLPGYEEATPMVFCGLFPVDADQFPELRDALEKLQLNDAALKFEPETSSAMGFGFRCGFLGLLHMEIVQERLEREYNLTLITTAPSVVYRVNCMDGQTIECSNPSLLPEPGKRKSIEEPFVKIEMLTPKEYIGSLMELGQERRGEFKEMNYITENRASLVYHLPLAEMVGDFFDQLKSRTKGYASMEYSFVGYRESDLVKLDVQINGEPVEPLSTIVHKDKAYAVGRALTQKLKELIPRQMFKIPIQACIGTKVIASESLSAIRKDVLSKCYGGDVSRKKKLLKKQAEGKKRMKAVGKVDVPQEAFMAVLRLEKEVL